MTKGDKIVVTGSKGQLGHALCLWLSNNGIDNVVAVDLDELDITNEAAVGDFFAVERPQYIVNCAAYTAVDRAESEPLQCRQVNAVAVGILAHAAKKYGTRMVHISTDYVFDGNTNRPYIENDATNPLQEYGASKLEGERMLLDSEADAVVLRTQWLYSPWGVNFVKTMLRLGRERSSLRVVADQIGSPTSALDLATAIGMIITGDRWTSGVYHCSSEGVASWFDFTLAIHELAGITKCAVTPCDTSQYPTPAKRPLYGVMNKAKLNDIFGIEMPHWRNSLKACLTQMQEL